MKIVNIYGAGLAGSEAAWQAASMGAKVRLHEMRIAGVKTDAHKTNYFGELVCSNSFRNDDPQSAIGLLHKEMRMCDSLIISCGEKHRVPAGSALAMDRDNYALEVTNILRSHPNIEIIAGELKELPRDDGNLHIIATGPLTSRSLSDSIKQVTGEEYLAFFDAIAPIIYKDSINFDIAWFQSRYDKGEGKDYINLPMNRKQYYNFIEELLAAEKTSFHEWEKNTDYFNGCLPIEVMAERGPDTLKFGPMKPVGLTNPNSKDKPYAVVQLRQDNKLGTLYNMVGFQTKMKYGEQKRIFSTIPGLEACEFARLGGLHRNTFINSPKLLNRYLELKAAPHISFAGQITGVEGYVESAAVGIIAGRIAASKVLGLSFDLPPDETAIGSLVNHITSGAEIETFQPMNVNYGLFPPLLAKIGKRDRKEAYSERAIVAMRNWLGYEKDKEREGNIRNIYGGVI